MARCRTIALALGLVFLAAGTTARPRVAGAADAAIVLRGAGATFPAPLYEQWIRSFRLREPAVGIEYDAVGSGEGVRRFVAGSVDFGASDSAMTDEQIAQVKAGARLVPVTAGAVVIVYNLPGLAGGSLRLERDVLVGIFAGLIRRWDDPRIRASNPGLTFPNRSIALVARQDGSGTTFALTNHLSAISDTWRDRGPGVGTLVDWRGRAMLARGNEGVAARVRSSEYSIGYVEFNFARRLGLPMATLQNRAGRFVEPGDRSGQAAFALNAAQMPANLRLFLPDPTGDDAYPIVTLSWLLLYERYGDARKAAALKQFVNWGLTEGQAHARDLGYIPLPDTVVSRSAGALDRIQ